jgi:TPR repeat protein
MARIAAALLGLATIAMIGWCAYWAGPQTRTVPDSGLFVALFFGGLALPYLVTLAMLGRGDGRDGLRCALGVGLVNAVWALPLGALHVLFAGFAMGNRAQEQQIIAVAAGAALQLPLLAVAGVGLWRGRAAPGSARPAAHVWLLAFGLPIVSAATSWGYFNWQVERFKARSARAGANDRAAQETVKLLQGCLAAYRERGYPESLDACPEAVARMGEASGYRLEYLPALPAADGRRGAYLVCAQPLRFRATGFSTVVADATGFRGAGPAADQPPETAPTCASVLGIERAIAWCAYQSAARAPALGYPRRLAEIAPCVSARRSLREVGSDRLRTEDEQDYAYLSDPSDANGRVAGFRIYRRGFPGGGAVWIDDQLRESEARIEKGGPVVDGLPDIAAPERFEPGCAEGRAGDCFLAGHEWQRKAFQAGGKESEPPAAQLNRTAVKAFERGCHLDDGRSCTWLGLEVERGVNAERDVVRAAGLYEKGCTLGYRSGCIDAARMYETGRKAYPDALGAPRPPPTPKPDLPRDVARSVTLYERGCQLGEPAGCFVAGRVLAEGEGIAPDPERALGLFARLCDDGLALACSRAAGLAPGPGNDFWRRGCVLGDDDACKRGGR